MDQVASVLGKLTSTDALRQENPELGTSGLDVMLHTDDIAFAVEWKAVGDIANVGNAVRDLTPLKASAATGAKPVVPIVAVPFMGETARRLCAEAGLSWIDLSGNAWIDAPGRHVRVLGNPNRFAAPGRPANVFAPKSSRLIRAFLMAPNWTFTQADLVEVSGVDKGRVSRLVRRLEAMGLLERAEGNAVQVRDPRLALQAWREVYDFERHYIRRGVVDARSPDELVEKIARSGVPYAFTALAAAARLTSFSTFHLTTVFMQAMPTSQWLQELGFRDDPRGANLWLVQPADDGVFEGARDAEGVRCVHPLQVYLDLKLHPERSKEAAEKIHTRFLDWRSC